MQQTAIVSSDFDDKFIQMAIESSRLHECLCILTDKIDEIESPSDLTLDKLNKISALAKLIESYADKHSDLVNKSYMLVKYRKD